MRRAVIDDIPALVKLAETMHAEGSYKDIPFDADFYGDVLNICLLSDTEIIFVFIKDGVLAGAIHGSIEPFMFNAKYTQAVDRGFFVRPEYRGSSIAVKLERAYRKWAADQGAIRVCLQHSNGYEKAGEFFMKLGYNYTGRNYVLKLEGG